MDTQTQYFTKCKTLDEAKTLYKKLARENHPDLGGDLRAMQEINRQWAQFQAKGATNEARERQRTANAEGKKSAADYHNMDDVEKALFDVINFAVNLDGVEVELMGLAAMLHKLQSFTTWKRTDSNGHRTEWQGNRARADIYTETISDLRISSPTMEETIKILQILSETRKGE